MSLMKIHDFVYIFICLFWGGSFKQIHLAQKSEVALI